MSEGKRVIVLAVDQSKHADHAFDWYLKNVRMENDYLVCIFVPEALDFEFTSPAVVSKVMKELAEEVEELKKKIEKRMIEAKLTGKFKTAMGKPGEVICKLAKEEGAQLVVCGTRGQGKIRRTIMGSVSDYIVHHSHVPVLVCRQ